MAKSSRSLVAIVCITTFSSIVATWHWRGMITENLIALVDLPYRGRQTSPLSKPVEARLVAHAGGAVEGHTYTNSREALDVHYAQGYRVFELDFNWTSDNKLVAVHDWNDASKKFGTWRHIFSYSEYIHKKRLDGLRQMTFEDVRIWLQQHPDAFVVTDTKDSNTRFLRYLMTNARDVAPQLIIQIYRMSEVQAARELDPRAVWLTVYRYELPPWALSFSAGVDALVIPVGDYERYRDPLLMKKMHFYVHSVSAESVETTLGRMPGIYGAYVD